MSSEIHKSSRELTSSQNEEEVKFGIVGYGNLGTQYADSVDGMEDIETVAVADPNPIARENADNRGLNAYESHHELAENEDIDVAAVIVPHKILPEITNDLQDYGIAPFPEKPLGTSKEEIEHVIDKRDETEETIGIGLQRRHEHYNDIANIIETEDLGEVENIHAELHQNWLQKHEENDGWRLNYDLSGGGNARDSWMHQLDGIFDTLGAVPQNVETDYIDWSDYEGIEKVARAEAELDMGDYTAEGSFLIDGHSDKEWLEYLNIEFENGSIALTDIKNEDGGIFEESGYSDKKLVVDLDEGPEYIIDDFEVKGGYENGTQAKIADMAYAVQNGGEPEATPEDMYRTAAFVDAVYESAETGEGVELDELGKYFEN